MVRPDVDSGLKRNRFNLKRVVWRWHFLAALFVSPVLFVVSLTGAIYVFKPDVEPWLYPDVLSVEGLSREATIRKQIESAAAYVGEGWSPVTVDLDFTTATRPNGVVFENESYEVRTTYVDPGSGAVLGELPSPHFFGVVLAIHESLMSGTIGRVFTELATCWSIFLLITGVVLWWPRSFAKAKGVWLPRIKASPYVILRDLHTLTGIAFSPVLMTILVSGLLFTLVWGTAYHTTALISNSYAARFDPPKSNKPQPDSERVSIDKVWSVASDDVNVGRASIHLPRFDEDSFRVEIGQEYGSSVSEIVVVDQYGGELLLRKRLGELPIMAAWTSWGYPLHVGSFLGTASKIVWCLASILLGIMPVTGLAMWLVRRRRGTSGFPKKIGAATPRWLVALLLLFGVVLPTVGLTMILAILVDLAVSKVRNSRNE